MEENKILKELQEECTAYIMYGQNIHPTHVRDMIKKAFEAGLNENK